MFKNLTISICLFSLVLFGCSQKKLTPKDILVVAIDSEPSNLDPRFALDAYSQRIDQLLFDGLVILNNNLEVVPHLATHWTVRNNKIYQFTLHPNLTFHDGTPLTAHDIAFTLEQILDPAFGSPLLGSFKNVEKIIVLNKLALEIHLKEPQASFLTDLTLIKALPHQKMKDSKVPFKDVLIGSGPYTFLKKEVNTIILKKNPTHFLFKPKMENLIFKVIKDDNTRSLKLKKGEIDLIQNALSSDSVIKLSQDPHLTLTKSAGLTYSYLGFNLKDPILKNKKFRQAMSYALDRKTIIEHLLQNLATSANSILSPLNHYYDSTLSQTDFNLEKAKELLKESQVPLPVKLIFKTSTDTQAINIARLISDQLKALGVMVELRTNEWGTFFNDIQTGNFQLFSLRWVGVTDPDIYYDAFHSSNFPPGKNRIYYSNPTTDRLLQEGRVELNPEKRKKIYARVQKILAEEVPYIHLWHFNHVALYTQRLKGFYFHPQA
ncbi:MAG: hypothetical protein A3A72_00175, partial [Deltaproteobacteria bacterium RIFCSPLOWO2_01_FULL_38_9]